jgi:hypothetical protein
MPFNVRNRGFDTYMRWMRLRVEYASPEVTGASEKAAEEVMEGLCTKLAATVWRYRLTVSKPVLKAPMISALEAII